MKVLITGSNGFIGSHICCYLKAHNVYIIGLGRKKNPAFSEVDDYIQCDISDSAIENVLNTRTVDAIIHLAADMRRSPYEIDILHHNCIGTQRLLSLCQKNGICTFVQLSSMPVIGKPQYDPIKETHPVNPPTIYHLSKYIQELLANYANKDFSLRTVSLRIPSPIGLGMNEKTILPSFIQHALKNEVIEIWGNGTRKQNYVHVSDIAQAIYRVLISENAQGLYNIGSENLISNLELAELCVDVLHSKSTIVFNGMNDPADSENWNICYDSLHNDTGYSPTISLKEAIEELAESFRKKT